MAYRWAGRPNRAVRERFQWAFEAAGARVVDGSAILREVRWKKSAAGMACQHEAARIAVAGLERARGHPPGGERTGSTRERSFGP